jgi:hypothetical protein
MPYSLRSLRLSLTKAVRVLMSLSSTRWRVWRSCCTTCLTGATRMMGRVKASQIASASRASRFGDWTEALTICGAISRTSTRFHAREGRRQRGDKVQQLTPDDRLPEYHVPRVIHARGETPASRCRCRGHSSAVPWTAPPLGKWLPKISQLFRLVKAAPERGGSISLRPRIVRSWRQREHSPRYC